MKASETTRGETTTTTTKKKKKKKKKKKTVGERDVNEKIGETARISRCRNKTNNISPSE